MTTERAEGAGWEAADVLAPEVAVFSDNDPALFGKALSAAARAAVHNPLATVSLTARLGERLWNAGTAAVSRLAGRPADGPMPVPKDKRFTDPAWEENPAFWALRQGYMAASTDPAALGSLAGRSAGTLMVLLRALLTLLGRSIPRDPLQLGVAGAEALGVDSEPLLHVLRHRAERGWRCSAEEFERYMDMAHRAVRFLDQLQLGEQR